MKRKHHALTEHYLVPAVLILLNVCLVHLIYAFVEGAAKSTLYKTALIAAFLLLASSLVAKRQAHLAGAILFYGLVAFLL